MNLSWVFLLVLAAIVLLVARETLTIDVFVLWLLLPLVVVVVVVVPAEVGG